MVVSTRMVCLVVAAVSGCAIAGPTVVFSDNFDAENGGNGQLNYNSFQNWTVSDGTVDLIGNGFFDFLPGNGLYVDLDGSTFDPGVLTQSTPIFFKSGVEYTLSFELAGNNTGGGDDTVTVFIDVGALVSDSITLAEDDPFTTFTYTFLGDGTSKSIAFSNDGNNNIGALLDDVVITAVPLPTASALAGLGLVGMGVRRRRGSL